MADADALPDTSKVTRGAQIARLPTNEGRLCNRQAKHGHCSTLHDESIWTRAYMMGLDPAEAAELAAREYDATHPPDWIKRRR
jgi:hypothetical protein